MMSQAEAGHLCPITMTHAALAALRLSRSVARQAAAEDRSRDYDPRFRADGADKARITLGMGMTEKQGGTDVRANITRAAPSGDGLRHHRPQMVHVGADVRRLSDSCASAGRAVLFPAAALPPRRQPQRHCIQRLKDKLGNRSNASSEVEFIGAFARRVGEEGRGVRTIIEW